ncbi:MAG: lysophospholipid acyltransferase family protein [Bacteroidetes bacterium]|nr:lysophospholipid acyltransferase family protein [Bacteroidota bacterium]
MLQFLASAFLKLFGWDAVQGLPKFKKYVLIGAPHTSNWDFVLAMLVALAIGLRFKWLGKHTLFKNPFGYVLKFFGGIPIDRTIHSSVIERVAEMFNNSERLVIAITPEGTRSKTEFWKSGFYYIALNAKVPVAFAFLDYENKKIGVGDHFIPCGDIDADMQIIRNFYSGIKGKRPEKQGEVRVRPKVND